MSEKKRRCKYFEDDGIPIGKGCFRTSENCDFAHPEDHEWETAESTQWIRDKEKGLKSHAGPPPVLLAAIKQAREEHGIPEPDPEENARLSKPLIPLRTYIPDYLSPNLKRDYYPKVSDAVPVSSPLGMAFPPSAAPTAAPGSTVMYHKSKDPRLSRNDSYGSSAGVAAASPNRVVSAGSPPTAATGSPLPVAAPVPIPLQGPTIAAMSPTEISSSMPSSSHTPLGAAFSMKSPNSSSISTSASPKTTSFTGPTVASPQTITFTTPFTRNSPAAMPPPSASPTTSYFSIHPPLASTPTGSSFPANSNNASFTLPPSPMASFTFDNPQGPLSPTFTAPPLTTTGDIPERPPRPPVPAASEEERAVWKERIRLMAAAIRKQTALKEAEKTLIESKEKLSQIASSGHSYDHDALTSQLSELEEEKTRLEGEAAQAQDAFLSACGPKVHPSEHAVEIEQGIEEERREMVRIAAELKGTAGLLARTLGGVWDSTGKGTGRPPPSLDELADMLVDVGERKVDKGKSKERETETKMGMEVQEEKEVQLQVEQKEREAGKAEEDVEMAPVPPTPVVPKPLALPKRSRRQVKTTEGAPPPTSGGPPPHTPMDVDQPPPPTPVEKPSTEEVTPPAESLSSVVPQPTQPQPEPEIDQAMSKLADLEDFLSTIRNDLAQHEREYCDLDRLEGFIEEKFICLEDDEKATGGENGEEALDTLASELKQTEEEVGELADFVADTLQRMNQLDASLKEIPEKGLEPKMDDLHMRISSLESSYAQNQTTLATLKRALHAYTSYSPSPPPTGPSSPVMPSKELILSEFESALPNMVQSILRPQLITLKNEVTSYNVWEKTWNDLSRTRTLIDSVAELELEDEQERERKRIRMQS